MIESNMHGHGDHIYNIRLPPRLRERVKRRSRTPDRADEDPVLLKTSDLKERQVCIKGESHKLTSF